MDAMEFFYEESDAGFVPHLGIRFALRDGVASEQLIDDETSRTAGVQDDLISSEQVRGDGYHLEDEAVEQTEGTFGFADRKSVV